MDPGTPISIPDPAKSTLFHRHELHSKTPTLAFISVCLGAFLLERLVLWSLRTLVPFNDRTEAVADAVTLLVVMTPLLLFLFVRPMARVIREKTQAEQALRLANRDLESKVRLRTTELESANESLHEEVGQRARAMARLQIQGKLLDAVQQAVVATGREGTVIYWNRSAETMFGWSQLETQGKILEDIGFFPAGILALDHSEEAPAAPKEGEAIAIRRDGKLFPAYFSCSPILRNDRSLGGYVCTFINIADRKEAEEAIRHSEERYSTVVESSPTGIFIYQNDQITFANRRFYEMVGWEGEDQCPLRPSDLVHPEDWPGVQAIWRDRIEGERATKDHEFRILTPAGGIRWLSGRSAVIHIRGQKALLGNVQDVTERLEAVQALRDSRERLQRLSADQLAAQELERKRVARELHDSLGQSLSAIKFMAERALECAHAEDLVSATSTIRAVVPVVQSTMEEVRRISMALRPSTLDDLGLLMTISWFIRDFQVTYPSIQVDKIIEVEESQVPETHKTNLFRILQESLNNAAKYSRAKRIALTLKQVDGALHMSVEDDGIGFDAAAKRKRDQAGGHGINSMRERAEFSGGRLALDSSPGKGTHIRVWLPVST